MQIILRINDAIYRKAKAHAARAGMTPGQFIEKALLQSLRKSKLQNRSSAAKEHRFAHEIAERNRLMETLLLRTAHFGVDPRPTREEMNER